MGLKGRESHRPGELSGGEQQRLAIAVALANDPPVIFADEPTVELDNDNAKVVVDLLVGLAHEECRTVVVTTHDPRVAIRTDRIIRLEDGVLKGIYTPTQLEGAYQSPGRGSLSGLAGVIRARIARIDKEMGEIENSVREGKLSFKRPSRDT